MPDLIYLILTYIRHNHLCATSKFKSFFEFVVESSASYRCLAVQDHEHLVQRRVVVEFGPGKSYLLLLNYRSWQDSSQETVAVGNEVEGPVVYTRFNLT